MISVGGVPVIGGRTVAAADISDASATGRNVLTGGAAAGRDALGAVLRGSHVADASALPTPTAALLGAQYLLAGGVDGLGAPLLATCVTDDGVAYSWGVVLFGADVAGLRDALSLGGAAVLSVGTTGGTVAAGDDSRITGAVPTSRTVAGASLSADVSTATIASALGLGAVTATGDTAADARAAIGAPGGSVATYGTGGDTAWTGWTLTSAANSVVSITGGRIRVVTIANVGFTGGNASLTLAQALLLGGFRLRVRLATYTGADTNSRWGVKVGHTTYWHVVNSNGSMGGAWNGSGGDSAVSCVALDGTTWFEFVFSGGHLTTFYGTGTTSTAPTAWSVFRCGDVALTSNGITSALPVVTLFAGQVAGGAVSVTCEWDHVTIAPIGVGL